MVVNFIRLHSFYTKKKHFRIFLIEFIKKIKLNLKLTLNIEIKFVKIPNTNFSHFKKFLRQFLKFFKELLTLGHTYLKSL